MLVPRGVSLLAVHLPRLSRAHRRGGTLRALSTSVLFHRPAVTFPPTNPFPPTWVALALVQLGTLWACSSELYAADPEEPIRQARLGDAFGARRAVAALETLRWYCSPNSNPGVCCNLPDVAPLLVRAGVLDVVKVGLGAESEDVQFTAASLLCALLSRSELQRRVARDADMLCSLASMLQTSMSTERTCVDCCAPSPLAAVALEAMQRTLCPDGRGGGSAAWDPEANRALEAALPMLVPALNDIAERVGMACKCYTTGRPHLRFGAQFVAPQPDNEGDVASGPVPGSAVVPHNTTWFVGIGASLAEVCAAVTVPTGGEASEAGGSVVGKRWEETALALAPAVGWLCSVFNVSDPLAPPPSLDGDLGYEDEAVEAHAAVHTGFFAHHVLMAIVRSQSRGGSASRSPSSAASGGGRGFLQWSRGGNGSTNGGEVVDWSLSRRPAAIPAAAWMQLSSRSTREALHESEACFWVRWELFSSYNRLVDLGAVAITSVGASALGFFWGYLRTAHALRGTVSEAATHSANALRPAAVGGSTQSAWSTGSLQGQQLNSGAPVRPTPAVTSPTGRKSHLRFRHGLLAGAGAATLCLAWGWARTQSFWIESNSSQTLAASMATGLELGLTLAVMRVAPFCLAPALVASALADERGVVWHEEFSSDMDGASSDGFEGGGSGGTRRFHFEIKVPSATTSDGARGGGPPEEI